MPAEPDALQLAAIDPVATETKAAARIPSAARFEGRFGVGMTPELHRPSVQRGAAQLGEGLQQGCGDAVGCRVHLSFASIRVGMQQPGFVPATTGLAAIAGDPAQRPLVDKGCVEGQRYRRGKAQHHCPAAAHARATGQFSQARRERPQQGDGLRRLEGEAGRLQSDLQASPSRRLADASHPARVAVAGWWSAAPGPANRPKSVPVPSSAEDRQNARAQHPGHPHVGNTGRLPAVHLGTTVGIAGSEVLRPVITLPAVVMASASCGLTGTALAEQAHPESHLLHSRRATQLGGTGANHGKLRIEL